MALYKDGKVYRTLEQQVGHLTEAHKEQLEINLSVESDINNLEDAVEGKQDKLTFDTIPVDGSTNPVESNGIYDALAEKLDKGDEIFVVELSSSSGTLTDSNYDLLLLNNTIIKLTISTTSSYLNKIGETSSSLRYGCVQNDTSRIYILTITKSTKEYSVTNKEITIVEDGVQVIPSVDIIGKVLTVNSNYKSEWKTPEIHSSNIVSDNVASGHVLTSNGSNGATWQTIPAQTPEGTSIKSTGVTSGKVLTANGSNGASWEDVSGGLTVVTAGDVDSESAINGQVLTANGSGSATWETPSGGGLEIIDVGSSSSGTFTTEQYNKITSGKAIVKRSNDYYWLQYKLTTTYIRLVSIYVDYTNKYFTGRVIRINQSTRTWDLNSLDVYQKITKNYIDSETTTSGKVLTADGSGGASWTTPSGGTAKYHHRVNGYVMLNLEGSDVPFAISLDFYNNISTAYTSIANVISALITAGYTFDAGTEKPNKICNGYIWNRGNSFSDFSVFLNITALNYGGNNYLVACDIHGTSLDTALFAVGTQTSDNYLTDDVIALVG